MALPDMSIENQTKDPEENPPEDSKNGDSEPLLIGDGTPSWLMNRLLALRRKTRTPGDSFACVLDVLMHEAGFSSQDAVNSSLSFDIRVMRSLSSKELKYDSENSCYCLEYYYGDVKNRCDLVITVSSDLAIVNLVVPDSKSVPLIFVLSEYIEFDNITIKNAQKLSLIVKEALCEIKIALGSPNQLLSLPTEMLIAISQYLSAESFAALTASCKLLRTYYDEESIWRYIARHFYPLTNFPPTTYKEFVIYQVKDKIKMRKGCVLLHHYYENTPRPYLEQIFPGLYQF